MISFECAVRGVRMACAACGVVGVRARTASFCNPISRVFALSSVPTRTNQLTKDHRLPDALMFIHAPRPPVRSLVRQNTDASGIAPIEVTTLGRAEKSTDILQRPPAGGVGRPLRNKT